MTYSFRDVVILAIVPICCLAVYGIVSIVPPRNLVNFPFKGWPVPNGVLFGIAYFAFVALALFMGSEIPR